MLVRNDHQVTACIWESVEDQKNHLASKDNQIFGAIGPCHFDAERAPIFRFVRLDVRHTPGGPYVFQSLGSVSIIKLDTCYEKRYLRGVLALHSTCRY